MHFWAKYNTQTDIRFAIVKRGVVDLAAGADWTPATGDTRVSKDGGNYANSSNNPAAVGGTGSVGWKLTLTAADLQCAELNVQIVDSATKAVEDQFLVVYTYGHANAKIQADLSDVVRLGLTALPNAAAEAAGGLYTRGSSAGQINQPANGQIDVNIERWNATLVPAEHTAGYPVVTLKAGTGTGEVDTASGRVKVTEAQIDQIVDEVWDEDVDASHQTAGSAGKKLDDAGSSASPSAIADAVWDEALAGHLASGSTGAALDAAAAGSLAGPGALERTISFTVSGNPLQGASVWVATDAAGSNVIAGPLSTNSAGEVTLLLDAGTYYAWVRLDGYNPVTGAEIEVS